MNVFVFPQCWIEEFKPLPDEWLEYFIPSLINKFSDAKETIREIAEKFKIAEHFLIIMLTTESNITLCEKYHTDKDVIYPCGLEIEGLEGLYSQLNFIASLFKHYYNGIFLSDNDYANFHKFQEYTYQQFPYLPEEDFHNDEQLFYYSYKWKEYVYFENTLSLNYFKYIFPCHSKYIETSIANECDYDLFIKAAKQCRYTKSTIEEKFAECLSDIKQSNKYGFDFYIKLFELDNGLMPSEFKNLNLHAETLPNMKSPVIETINDDGDCVFFKDNFLSNKKQVRKNIRDNYHKYQLQKDC